MKTGWMPDAAGYDLIIFDFHKTLTDMVYFDHFDTPTREQISDLIFRPPSNRHWEYRWMTGEIRCTDILTYLAEETGIRYADLERGLQQGIENIRWNHHIWSFARSIRPVARTAIATINNDLFERFIVPRYQLEDSFDAIVNSYTLKAESKTDLCIAAARQLNLDPAGSRILLIDDKQANIDEFIAAGGEGYLYRSDREFGRDLAG